MARRSVTLAVLLAAAVPAAALLGVPLAVAAFSSATVNSGNVIKAAPDFRAPVVGTVVIGKSLGGATGFLKQGAKYFVYANVAADTGNPASGTKAVSADVAGVTTGSSAVTLVAGTYPVAATTFNYRSAELTANGTIAEGAKAFTVTATDNAGNAAVANGSVAIDNTAPKAADVQTTNVGGGTNGLAEQNDTLVLSFGEPVDPTSILSGWDGGATSVTLRVNDNGLLGSGNDSVQIYNAANNAVLPLGTIDLGRNDYAGGLLGGNYRFLSSTMSMAGSVLTVALGTYNSTIIVDPGRVTAGGVGTAAWTPVTTVFDRAGNALSATAPTESGGADKEF